MKLAYCATCPSKRVLAAGAIRAAAPPTHNGPEGVHTAKVIVVPDLRRERHEKPQEYLDRLSRAYKDLMV